MRKQDLREGKEPVPATQHGNCITRAAVAGSWKFAFPKEEFVMPRTGKEGVCGFDADMTLGRAVNTGVPPVAPTAYGDLCLVLWHVKSVTSCSVALSSRFFWLPFQ